MRAKRKREKGGRQKGEQPNTKPEKNSTQNQKRRGSWLLEGAAAGCLDKVSDVGGHLFDLGVVEFLKLTEAGQVILGDEVDGNTLATETTGTTDTVKVALGITRQVKVDNQGNLLDINTTGKQIGGDEDTRGTGTELLQDDVTLLLGDVTVGGGDGELAGPHLLGQVVDLPAGVAKDDSLGNVQGVVEIAKGVELPVLLLDINVELTDTFQGQLLTLHQNLDGVVHEPLSDLEGIRGHGGRAQHDLESVGGKSGEDVVDLVLETTGQHFVGLIKNEQLDVRRVEDLPHQHVHDTTGGTDNDVDTVLKAGNIIGDTGSTDARVATDVEVVSESENDLLDLLGQLTGGGKDKGLASNEISLNPLEDTDGKSRGFPSSRLSLSDDIASLDDGEDGPLLNSRRLLKTHSINTTEQGLLEVHGIEVTDDSLLVALVNATFVVILDGDFFIISNFVRHVSQPKK